MTSVVISHIICTAALLTLILVLPFAYANIRDNIKTNVTQLELKEIADYVSSTLANTYFLVNSTNSPNTTLTKALVYLPQTVEGSFFKLKIDGNLSYATGVTVELISTPPVKATAWLPAGLSGGGLLVESKRGLVLAGCIRNSTGTYVLLDYEEHSQ